jgi:hypothetical protein
MTAPGALRPVADIESFIVEYYAELLAAVRESVEGAA